MKKQKSLLQLKKMKITNLSAISGGNDIIEDVITKSKIICRSDHTIVCPGDSAGPVYA